LASINEYVAAEDTEEDVSVSDFVHDDSDEERVIVLLKRHTLLTKVEDEMRCHTRRRMPYYIRVLSSRWRTTLARRCGSGRRSSSIHRPLLRRARRA
jgi:hypothetical protein